MAKKSITRRDFIKTAGIGVVGAGLGPTIFIPSRSQAASARKTLKILQWVHFVPAYDKWFNEKYIKEWGEKNNTEVTVDNIGLPGLGARAAAEASAQKGHDLFLFEWPPPFYEEQVVDLKDVHAECEKKYGKPIDLATRSTYNPKTKKYFGFSPSFVPDPINWRKDLWDDVGVVPDSWDKILDGGRKIKQKHNIPLGIGLAQELDTAMAMRTIMYSFGAHEQDAAGYLALNSKNTVEAVKFVKALFQEAMTPEVFTWDPSSNNRAMLAGTISLTLNAISDHAHGRERQSGVHREDSPGQGSRRTRAPNRLGTRDGCLRDLEVRREHRRRQEVSRRLCGQLPPGVRERRVLQLPLLPEDRA